MVKNTVQGLSGALGRIKKLTRSFEPNIAIFSFSTASLSRQECIQFIGMLAARRIPQILQDSLGDGIDGMCLMTKEGSLLSSSFTAQATIDEIGLAAISSSIWGNYSEGSPDMFLHIIKLENGYLGICSAGNGYLLAASGRDLSVGLLRSRLLSLSRYFAKVFEQVK